MTSSKTGIDELARLLREPYSHLELGQVNDHAAYLLNFKNDFPFHSHTKDEMYLVLEGQVTIRFKHGKSLVLARGQSTVVRAYTTHSPDGHEGALVLMFKPKEMFADMAAQE